MILIGSKALQLGLEKTGLDLSRKPVDLDFFAASHKEAFDFVHNAGIVLNPGMTSQKWTGKGPDGTPVEIEIAGAGDSTRYYMFWAETMAYLEETEVYGQTVEIAPIEMLYSLKKSHRHSPRAFHKHVVDYNWLRLLVSKDPFPKITDMRYRETMERVKKTPSLNKSKEDFFDDSVSNKTFIHDEIHEVMAHGKRPMFEKIRISPDKVTCSKEKWEKLEESEKCQCVQEEAYVIALERAIIPMLFEGGPIAKPFEAYKWAVMRICTTLCSGWFREWALHNYAKVLFWYSDKYVEKFLQAVESGRIKRIQK